MSSNGILIPQLLILGISIFCAAVAIYCFPSPQSWPVLALILAAIAIAIIASVAIELLPWLDMASHHKVQSCACRTVV